MISLTPAQLTVLRPAAAPPAYVIEAYANIRHLIYPRIKGGRYV